MKLSKHFENLNQTPGIFIIPILYRTVFRGKKTMTQAAQNGIFLGEETFQFFPFTK